MQNLVSSPPPNSELQVLTARIDQALRESILDPVLFCQNFLSVETWSKQELILQSIYKNRQTAVKACHASSKTFTAACATLHFLARYENATVITTAPTQKQVEALLWAEIHRLIRQSKYPFPKPTLSKLTLAPKRYAFGFTTSVDNQDEGVKFQGFHNDHVLIIFDEAPGIDGKIWQAAQGILSAGDTRFLALGNPTISSGPFYDAFGIFQDSWETFTISAFDTPNLFGTTIEQLLAMSQDELNYSPTPYLVSRYWVLERFKEWGSNHPQYLARILGEFPSQSEDSLFSLTWLDASTERQKINTDAKIIAGIDVAGPGEDETVLVIRQGPNILLEKSWPDPDPRGEIVSTLRSYGARFEVNIDAVGIGYYMARHIEDQGYVVSDVNAGGSPWDKEKFVNKRAEFYWGFRMRLEAGDLTGLLDKTTKAQLAGIRFKYNSRGQVDIETKDKARERGVKSPDRAEAVMLAFAPSQQHGLFGYYEILANNKGEFPASNSGEITNVGMPPPRPWAQPLPPATREQEQAKLQKEAGGFMGYPPAKAVSLMGSKEGANSLGKIMTAVEQPIKCDNCASPFVSVSGEGVVRCGRCGHSSETATGLRKVKI